MAIDQIKEILNPVPEEVRTIRSHDPNDKLLSQCTGFEPGEYEDATHVLIGCPQDEGVARNHGRQGAKKAPGSIRKFLYKLQYNHRTANKLFDAGNVAAESLEESHLNLTRAASQFLKDGKKVISLGGGNDIAYADLKSLSTEFNSVCAINIDAHLDMRKSEIMTSGTPYRKAIEEKLLNPENFYEFGIRTESNSPLYLKEAEKMGVQILTLREILQNGVTVSFEKILAEIDNRPFFLGLDMDSIRCSDAPGVSAASPAGFSAREVLDLIHLSKKRENLKIFEITEVNPDFDIDNRTVKLAALFIYHSLFD